jgi:hypothetical protein
VLAVLAIGVDVGAAVAVAVVPSRFALMAVLVYRPAPAAAGEFLNLVAQGGACLAVAGVSVVLKAGFGVAAETDPASCCFGCCPARSGAGSVEVSRVPAWASASHFLSPGVVPVGAACCHDSAAGPGRAFGAAAIVKTWPAVEVFWECCLDPVAAAASFYGLRVVRCHPSAARPVQALSPTV